MDQSYFPLNYGGAVPGADSNPYVLFDSTNSPQFNDRSQIRFSEFQRYVLSLKNLQPGTLRAWSSNDNGSTWRQFFEVAVAAATLTRNNAFAIPTEPHSNFKVDWLNGGVAQGTFYVQQALDDGLSSIRPVASDSSGSLATSFSTTQLPAALGQQPKTGSISTVEASDSVLTAAASLRAPMRGEILVLAPGQNTSAVIYNVPDGSINGQPSWLGKFIEVYAQDADFYLQLSTGTNANVDDLVTSTLSTVNTRQSIAPAGNEGYIIPRGTSRQIPVLPTVQTFALKSSTAIGKLRTMVAQT